MILKAVVRIQITDDNGKFGYLKNRSNVDKKIHKISIFFFDIFTTKIIELIKLFCF